LSTSLVFTFIGTDKPGLVEKIANTVAAQQGNWLESRLSQLAGQFAGIARVSIADSQLEPLCQALTALCSDELKIIVQKGVTGLDSANSQQHTITILGSDRPGIVKEVSSALAAHHINVCEMSSNITSAPMTAEPLFEATVIIQVPAKLDLIEISEELDAIANDLDIDLTLEGM
jgi:glycine cleavage system regulatory protein